MDIFLARQPIFDQRRRVVAYELLFRSGPENYFSAPNVMMPSAHVISTGMLGVSALTDGKRAFLNFSRESLLSDFASLLPPEDVVIELLESITADAEVLAACKRLKRAGFRIALDDYVDSPEVRPLLEVADYVKMDVLATSADECRRFASSLGSPPIPLLAEKVESWEVFNEAMKWGSRFFQGYFFSRPVMMSAKAIPGFRLNYLRLLDELGRPETSFERLEEIIKREASIAYRLLRRVNSAAYAFRMKVTSIRHALALLGEREIRTCAMVWIVADLGRDTPSELVVASTLRARMCETLAPFAGRPQQAGDLFLAGLFSLLDVILERPMEDLLESLPVDTEVRDVLLGKPTPMRTLLEAVMAYERGEWSVALEKAREAGIAEDRLADCYLQALGWVREIFGRAPGITRPTERGTLT